MYVWTFVHSEFSKGNALFRKQYEHYAWTVGAYGR